MVLETAKTLWSEQGKTSKMAAILEAAKRYSREVEHSDENIELLESRNIYYYLEDSTGITEGNYWRYVDGVPTIWTFETV